MYKRQVDIQPDRAERLAAACGLDRWYSDYREAVARDDVDVVSVCVPTSLHPAVTIFAAEHGKHILCEKPIALTVEAAQAMQAAAERNRVKLAVGFMRRYSPVLAELRALLANETGRPALYHAVDARELRPKREMHDPHANGGPVIDMGVHLFDLWSVIFDSQPVEVCAQGMALAQGRPEISHIPQAAVDTASIVVRYASGDVGSFVVTWGLPPKVTPPEGPDVLYAPKAAAQIRFGMNHQEVVLGEEGGTWRTAAVCDEDMYQREIASFARAILEDRPPVAGAEQGIAALRVALAVLE